MSTKQKEKAIKKTSERTSFTKSFFLISIFLILTFNIHSITKETSRLFKIREHIPYSFQGYNFEGLEKVFQNIEYVGYYTDRNVEEPKNNMRLSQAQFILAPTILDINDTSHKFTLFDCSNEIIAFNKIKELDLIPVKKNKDGIILTIRKP